MITFRYGDSKFASKMQRDRVNGNGVLWYSYPESGLSHAEQLAKAKQIIKSSANGHADVISVSDVIFDAIRLAVHDGEVKCSDFNVFYYTDAKISKLDVFPSGRIAVWPNGFMDAKEDVLTGLMD